MAGSGKTSLLRNILNMSTSFGGTISIGGESLDEIPKRLLRSHFGINCLLSVTIFFFF
jgi:ABC-type bacteriocin/lantibiotic exporter with double-glycine peptidase domain